MTKNTVTAYRTSSVSIRLIEIQDAGYVQVNDSHFALQVGRSTDISAALNQNLNIIQLVVQNKGTIIGGRWSGRFELYINGKLAGAYTDEGIDIRSNQDHLVAEIELQIIELKQDSEPDPFRIIHKLQLVPGMTSANKSYISKSNPFIKFQNGVTIYSYKNALKVDHIFVVDRTGTCVFGGYVGWIHSAGLQKALDDICQEYRQHLV